MRSSFSSLSLHLCLIISYHELNIAIYVPPLHSSHPSRLSTIISALLPRFTFTSNVYLFRSLTDFSQCDRFAITRDRLRECFYFAPLRCRGVVSDDWCNRCVFSLVRKPLYDNGFVSLLCKFSRSLYQPISTQDTAGKPRSYPSVSRRSHSTSTELFTFNLFEPVNAVVPLILSYLVLCALTPYRTVFVHKKISYSHHSPQHSLRLQTF